MLGAKFKIHPSDIYKITKNALKEAEKVSADQLVRISKDSTKQAIEDFKAVAPSSSKQSDFTSIPAYAPKEIYGNRFLKLKNALKFNPVIKKPNFTWGALGFQDAPHAFWLEYGHRLVRPGKTFRKDGQQAVWGFVPGTSFFSRFIEQNKGKIIEEARKRLLKALDL